MISLKDVKEHINKSLTSFTRNINDLTMRKWNFIVDGRFEYMDDLHHSEISKLLTLLNVNNSIFESNLLSNIVIKNISFSEINSINNSNIKETKYCIIINTINNNTIEQVKENIKKIIYHPNDAVVYILENMIKYNLEGHVRKRKIFKVLF